MLPIVQREVLAAARRGAFYKSRYLAGAAAGAGGLAALFWADFVWQVSVAPGEFLFYFTSTLSALFCFGAGLFLTVDSISSEKRQGTLGLLFLTELTGFDIVMGKLASSAATAATSFLTVFPIMGVSLCLGGVTGTQFWHMTLSLLALLVFSLCAGLFLSALVEKEGVGVTLFSTGMLAPTIICGYQLATGGGVSDWALLLNPLYPIFAAADLNFGVAPPTFLLPILSIPRGLFFQSLGLILFGSVLFVAAASIIVPFTVRTSVILALPKRIFGKVSARKKAMALEDKPHTHPVVWLSIRNKTPVFALWMFYALGALSLVWDPLKPAGAEYEGLFYSVFLHYVLKMILAFEAARLIAQEKDSGFMELLLTTPVQAGVVLHSKKAALRRHFLLPLIYAMSWHAWYIAQNAGAGGIGPWVALCSMIVLFFDFFTVGWFGLWEGLVARNAFRGYLRTLVGALALPWLPFFVFTGVLWFIFGRDFPADPALLSISGFISASVWGLAVGLYGLARVHNNLRRAIANSGH